MNFIKSLKKYLTLVNITTGLISLLFIVFIKELGLALFIYKIFIEYFYYIPECSIYIIASFTGLIFRLIIKGLVEDVFTYVFTTYNTLTVGDGVNYSDINPTDKNNSPEIKDNVSGGSSSLSGNSTGVQKEEEVSNKGKNPESSSLTESNSVNRENTRSNFSSKRYVKLFDEHAQRINSEIKELISEINNCKDEDEKTLKEEDLEELFGQLTMLSKESAAETRKILSSDSQTSNKRTSDSIIADNSSKKR
jgi:hypothetical protein